MKMCLIFLVGLHAREVCVASQGIEAFALSSEICQRIHKPHIVDERSDSTTLQRGC